MSHDERNDVHKPPHHGPEGEPMPEGEEEAPPGVRSAAIVRWGLVVLMALAAVGGWVAYTGVAHGDHADEAGQLWHCPMHPSVVQKQFGQCPICGMDLVKIEKGKGAATPAPPAGPAASADAAASVGNPNHAYWCPMHPEVTSDDPNATCAKCGGMKLMKRETSPAATPAGQHAGHAAAAPAASEDHSAHGVQGMVPVELTPERIQLMGMRTATVAREKLAPELRTVGFVSANEEGISHVHTRFSGWIEHLNVAQTGQEVKRGEVLATIYSPDILATQQEFLNALRWQQGAGEAAAPDKLASTLVKDSRRRLELLGVSSQEIEAIAKSGEPLRAMKIRAPHSGYVTEKTAIHGLYVTPDTTLFTVADLGTVWVVADVYEYEVPRVHKGQKARLVLAAYPGEAFTGRVQFVYPALDPQTRTLKVRIEFKNPALKLRPGMFGDVFLDTGSAEGLVVPSDALVDTGDVQYVFVTKPGGRFEPRKVKVGARGGGRVQLVSGVSEGESVVTTANFLLDSESRLRAAIEGQAGQAAGHAH